VHWGAVALSFSLQTVFLRMHSFHMVSDESMGHPQEETSVSQCLVGSCW
jgi:hypothetical protein